MGFKEILKSNTFIRRAGKKIKIYNEFRYDATDFCKYYLESAESKGNYKYRIMLLIHSLEKGLCMDNTRPFGFVKVKRLMSILACYSDNNKEDFEYQLGISTLLAWKTFFDLHGWTNEDMYNKVSIFISNESNPTVQAGYQLFRNPICNSNNLEFERMLLSRRSVRDYKKKKLEMKDIQFAIKCFVETPTACNRQMCKIYYIQNRNVKLMLDEMIIGIQGFNKNAVEYFVVTYDLNAFDYSGERAQGLLNAGLCTMNFIIGLHVKGIGSCCLQWSNKHSEDVKARKLLNLCDSERIAIIVGAGYYLDLTVVPCSVRKPDQEIFKII